jgi:integrase
VRRGAAWPAKRPSSRLSWRWSSPIPRSVIALVVLAAERSWLVARPDASAQPSVQRPSSGQAPRRGRHCQDASHGIGRVWRRARQAAFAAEVAASPLAKTPYDLRHAAVSTWLNGGVPPTTVAEWAGHSVEILLRIYAKCLDGGDALVRRRVQEALGYADTDATTATR